jgi:adenosylcobyric acid synthase
MVQGCSSWAGKSLLTTALARYFSRQGIRTAPFKALNMSNNARVVDEGEMPSAQYLQALAAGSPPDVRMGPVLVKPEADAQSQVVVMGRVDPELSRTSWRGRAASLWPTIETAYRSLAEEYDLVVIEGAGSPAEFNLWDCDVANMRVARLADAPVLLVADIDRGGAFAHLFGTWSMLPPEERELIRGFVLNRFRGDPSLLDPAPAQLEVMTGVPVVGIVPWLDHGLPDEDGAARTKIADDGPNVAIIRYPTASNLDEFKPLERIARLRWVTDVADLAGADLVILPGSKHVASDLSWLRGKGFADPLRRRATLGERVLGVCGGLQMLGGRIEDPSGVDGEGEGLGLLAIRTAFREQKMTAVTRLRFGSLPSPWDELSNLPLHGYEIRHGESTPTGALKTALPNGRGFIEESVLGIYLHGLFEEPAVLDALFGKQGHENLDATFDLLADAVSDHVDTALLNELVGI